MKRASIALLGAAALYAVMVVAPSAQAAGVGACVAGTGGSLTVATGVENSYVGVNVGTQSQTGVFDNEGGFEAACCTEAGAPPDCFEPVE